jgi:hypothetical protein
MTVLTPLRLKTTSRPGLPDFSRSKHTKTVKVYQMTTHYTKRPYIIPKDHPLHQTALRYTNIFHSKSLQNIPKFGIFGLKINHLATLIPTRRRSEQSVSLLSVTSIQDTFDGPECSCPDWKPSKAEEETTVYAQIKYVDVSQQQGCHIFLGTTYQNGKN